ncbi:MAG: squalene/phytoene synthase family protein [Pseudonocardia sp.]|nr:squalene/phytoene synthase family protein [Pseudonocardia sp.]
MTQAAPALQHAYLACEEITRREARNFSYGIRLLPPPKRSALSAVYALARRVDDIGDDGTRTFERKTIDLGAVRDSVERIGAGAAPDPADPVLVAVTDAAARYPIPLGAFGELVDGVEADARMDALAASTGAASAPYRTFEDMEGYCRQVAGSVGRLCLGIFGARPHPDAALFADQLGIALQQTNILRDIREDLVNGRIYLPTEELERFGVEIRLDPHGALADPDGRLAEYIRFAAERARGWYADGLRLVPLLDRRSSACAGAMAGIYRKLLDDIAADPASTYARRRSLSGRQKAGVALRALTGIGTRAS